MDPKLKAIRALAAQVERVHPYSLSKPQQAEFKALARDYFAPQGAMLMDAHDQIKDLALRATDEAERDRLLAAAKKAAADAARFSMLRNAASNIGRAKSSWDDELRSLILRGDDGKPEGIANYYGPGHWPGDLLAEEATYLEHLGASGKVPHAGRVLLRQTGLQFPDAPMLWQSLPMDETTGFYRSRGAVELPEELTKGTAIHSGSLPVFWVDEGRLLKEKDGGLVKKMKKGGLAKYADFMTLDEDPEVRAHQVRQGQAIDAANAAARAYWDKFEKFEDGRQSVLRAKPSAPTMSPKMWDMLSAQYADETRPSKEWQAWDERRQASRKAADEGAKSGHPVANVPNMLRAWWNDMGEPDKYGERMLTEAQLSRFGLSQAPLLPLQPAILGTNTVPGVIAGAALSALPNAAMSGDWASLPEEAAMAGAGQKVLGAAIKKLGGNLGDSNTLDRIASDAVRGYGKLAAEAIARNVEDGSVLTAMAQPAYVIKNKGGNWPSDFAQPKSVDELRDFLYRRLLGRSDDIEHGAAVLPSGRVVGPVRGTRDSVNMNKSSTWRDWENNLARQSFFGTNGARDASGPPQLWGTAHTHPKIYDWVDNGPSDSDLRWVSKLPKGDHQVVHQSPMVQEFYSIPDATELGEFAKAVTGRQKDNWASDALREMLNPRGYSQRTDGVLLPARFNSDRIGATARAIQAKLKDRGLIELDNTGSAADNDAIAEAVEQLKDKIPFAQGGQVRASWDHLAAPGLSHWDMFAAQ